MNINNIISAIGVVVGVVTVIIAITEYKRAKFSEKSALTISYLDRKLDDHFVEKSQLVGKIFREKRLREDEYGFNISIYDYMENYKENTESNFNEKFFDSVGFLLDYTEIITTCAYYDICDIALVRKSLKDERLLIRHMCHFIDTRQNITGCNYMENSFYILKPDCQTRCTSEK